MILRKCLQNVTIGRMLNSWLQQSFSEAQKKKTVSPAKQILVIIGESLDINSLLVESKNRQKKGHPGPKKVSQHRETKCTLLEKLNVLI